MKTIELLKDPADSFEAPTAPEESACSLNIAGVYQDIVTRDWALQTSLMATLLGVEARIQNKWYDVHALGEPDIFVEAVRAALVADVIVVSVYAAEELPLDLYVWVQAWLPRRLSRVGALAALVGVAEPPDSRSVHTLEYLKAVARKAQLDFVPREHKRPGADHYRPRR